MAPHSISSVSRDPAGIDGDKEIELAFPGQHLGDVEVEEADRITLEFLFPGLSPSVLPSIPARRWHHQSVGSHI
jgi:hypothetical protein